MTEKAQDSALEDSTKKKNALSRLHPNVWILSLGSFLTDVSSEMLFNLLPLFLVNVLNTRITYVGMIEGVAETTASLIKIISGRLSDRMGKRKWLTVSGYALSTLAKPFLYFAGSWWTVLGVRFSDRVGKGIRSAPRDALLAGSVEPERRGLAFGLHRALDTAGAFTGLAIAAVVIWLTQSGSSTLERSTFQTIVLISIIPAVLAVLVLALGVREVALGSSKTAGAAPTSAGARGMPRKFMLFLGVVVLFTLGNSSDAFITLRAQDRGLSVLQVMGMLLTFNAVYTVLSGPAGSLSDRVGRRKLLLTGWFVYTLVYLGLALSKTGAQVWILFGLYGIYYAMSEGVARALVADIVPANQRGTAFGYYYAAVGISALPASVIAGMLWKGLGSWQGFGPSAPFYFGAAMAMLAGILLFFLVREEGKA